MFTFIGRIFMVIPFEDQFFHNYYIIISQVLIEM